MTGTQLLQFILSGTTMGCIYAMVALGFTIIFNTTGIVNFAQGDFVMLGAMLAATFSTNLKLPLVLVVPLSVLGTASIGALMERTLIHSRKGKHDLFVLVMMTMGASIVFNALSLLIWGYDPLFLKAFTGEQPVRIYGATITPQMLWVVGGTILVMVLLIVFNRTNVGQGMIACSMNTDAASAMGIDVKRMVTLSFVISAGIGGLGGTLIAPITIPTFDLGLIMTLKGFTAAILGGLGNVWGAVIGGLLVGLIESLSCGFISSGYRDAITMGILIVMLMVKPSGITGSKYINK
jgi:branched-chain amino acid transport system permease protein